MGGYSGRVWGGFGDAAGREDGMDENLAWLFTSDRYYESGAGLEGTPRAGVEPSPHSGRCWE